MTAPYITGLAALCIPHEGRMKPFWHSLREPDTTWTVAGWNYPDTSHLFGDRELVDVSAYLALAGIQTTLSKCASYERSVFDLLYKNIEQNNSLVPNVQPSDIDDAVNFEVIRNWIEEWQQEGLLMHGEAMLAWLKPEAP